MKLLRRLRYLIRQRALDRELAEEIEFHRQMSGDPRAMGNITRAREDARAVWLWPWLESVWQDLSYALRSLRRQPGFAAVAVAALGTAIGFNTSFFTVFNAVALRPYPIQDPRSVVKIRATIPHAPVGAGLGGLGVAEVRYLAAHSKAFTGFTIFRPEAKRFGFEPWNKASEATFVAGNHFQLLGVKMFLGRGFLPEEDRPEAPSSAVVLSYSLWRDHFASDPGIVGRQVHVEDIPFTVVGVAPENFTGTSQNSEDAWFPLSALVLLHPTEPWPRDLLTKPDFCCSMVLGRLAPGVSRKQALAELDVLSRQFRAPYRIDSSAFVLADPTFLGGDSDNDPVVAVLSLVFLGVTLVVLLACANVGNLLLARALARQREIEVRRAVGASRARIVRQLLTESLVLALGAGTCGVLLAFRLPAAIVNQATDETPPGLRLTPDATVLAYTLVLATLTCLAIGLAPALHGTRARVQGGRLRLRSILLSSQVAMSVVLLLGAGLMFQGIRKASHQDPGFSIQDVTSVSFSFPAGAYDPARVRGFFARLSRDLSQTAPSLPLGLAGREPLAGGHSATSFRLPGEAPARTRLVEYQEVSPGFFDVLRIPIVAGRNLQAGDGERDVALLNETAARRWLGGEAVGKIALVGNSPMEIVGVVRDAYIVDLDAVPPTVFVPLSRMSDAHVLVRSASGSVARVAAAAASVDPRVRVVSAPLAENLGRVLSASRAGAAIAGMLGVFALILATVGMSGVFSYAIQQRTKEIGIRVALGARPAQVIRRVLAGSSRAVALGLACGFLAAASLARLLMQFLYGVSPLDPAAYCSVAAVVALAALAASYVPARRAARVDPVAALRHE